MGKTPLRRFVTARLSGNAQSISKALPFALGRQGPAASKPGVQLFLDRPHRRIHPRALQPMRPLEPIRSADTFSVLGILSKTKTTALGRVRSFVLAVDLVSANAFGRPATSATTINRETALRALAVR